MKLISTEEKQKRKDYITGMRKRGYTYRFIGKAIGLTHQMIHYIDKNPVSEAPPEKGCEQCGNLSYGRYCKKCRPRNGRDLARDLVRIRDKHTCQSCGRKWKKGSRRFDVHHLNGLCGKKSRKYDKVSEIHGLVTLCHKCHFNRHDFSGRKKK